LPASVRPFRRTVSPVELSAGTRPRNAINCRGVSNRRTSPISAANVTATRNEAPRMAWYAATTGAIDQVGTMVANCASKRRRR
jgi:hypothetical protein